MFDLTTLQLVNIAKTLGNSCPTAPNVIEALDRQAYKIALFDLPQDAPRQQVLQRAVQVIDESNRKPRL